ncbi:NTP transferase domain-containing protein [Candidatus Roizmanbacteria bacterium]|nr:NTP transferase domain-containing protein [Candidatus Roizmanbacteria bacterium]
MSKLQILLPMGGLGQRFRDAGYLTPKPLIDVNGRPMFRKALSSYDAYPGEKSYIFIIRKDTDDEYGLSEQIKNTLPEAQIKVLDHNTRGSVETCLIAEDIIDPTQPLVIMDCDIAFISKAYFAAINQAISDGRYDGLLLSFRSTDPRYSFAEIDEDNIVIRTAEKNPISNHALMGAYFFTKASYFIEAAHSLLSVPLSETMKEYYVSLIYNLIINQKKRIGLIEGIFYCFGTPEELNSYLKDHKD